MNAKNRTLITLVAVLTFCLFSLEQSASAQSDCKQAKGSFIDVATFPTTTGTITNGGILNGTTETVYNPAFVFTPNTDDQVVSYIGDLTITTHQGELKTSNVYIYNFATGLWTAMGRINPDTSAGRFAGATGVLYFNGKTIGVFPDQSYPSNIAGEICLANE